MNKKSKVIILDFDYTLFDGKKFKNALAKSLLVFGIDKKMWLETYNQVRYKKNKETGYIPEAHLKILVKKTKTNYKDLEIAYNKVIDNAQKYLYKDSIGFLEKLKKQEYTLYILTFGNSGFQKQKISASGINKYFKEIICTDKDKFKVSDQIPGVDEALFINDNPNEIAQLQIIHPRANFIQIKRPNAKKFDLKLKNINKYKNFNFQV